MRNSKKAILFVMAGIILGASIIMLGRYGILMSIPAGVLGLSVAKYIKD